MLVMLVMLVGLPMNTHADWSNPSAHVQYLTQGLRCLRELGAELPPFFKFPLGKVQVHN